LPNWCRNIENWLNRGFGVADGRQTAILVRCVLACLPVIGASLFAPQLVVALFALISVALIYVALAPVQKELFARSRTEIYWFVTMPLYWFFLGWGALVMAVGRPEQLGRSVGSFFLLAMVAIWPVFRSKKNRDRTERGIPFENVYLGFGLIVVIQQLVLLGRLFHA
jgi:hypothetical protein